MLLFLSTEFSDLEKKMHFIMEVVNEFVFTPYFISSGFYPKAAFTKVQFSLDAHVTSDQTSRVSFRFNELFHLELSEAHRPALEFIHRSRDVFWPYHEQRRRESDVALQVCSKVLQHICKPDTVVLEHTYRSLLSKKPFIDGVQTGYIGLGSGKTWHGTPDGRVRGTNIVISGREKVMMK